MKKGIDWAEVENELNWWKALPTGIDPLDNAIGGGLGTGTVTFLTGDPGCGKSTLAAQICENSARAENEWLYISPDMSAEVLLARSLARTANTTATVNKAEPCSAFDILRGSADKAVIEAAYQLYSHDIAPYLEYVDGKTMTASVRSYLADMAIVCRDAKLPAPNVCIDWLQFLSDENGDFSTNEFTRFALWLKNYAVKGNCAVIIVAVQDKFLSEMYYRGDLWLRIKAPSELGYSITTPGYIDVVENHFGPAVSGLPIWLKGGEERFVWTGTEASGK